MPEPFRVKGTHLYTQPINSNFYDTTVQKELGLWDINCNFFMFLFSKLGLKSMYLIRNGHDTTVAFFL
jgi:hypothetical protein